jgi:hypothetical protein
VKFYGSDGRMSRRFASGLLASILSFAFLVYAPSSRAAETRRIVMEKCRTMELEERCENTIPSDTLEIRTFRIEHGVYADTDLEVRTGQDVLATYVDDAKLRGRGVEPLRITTLQNEFSDESRQLKLSFLKCETISSYFCEGFEYRSENGDASGVVVGYGWTQTQYSSASRGNNRGYLGKYLIKAWAVKHH